jgi:aminoglycoside phosphotransferase family enzyme/predicted kinase
MVGQQEATLPPYVRALMTPDAYPHPADDIRLHETHISWVILAGAYAYKVKKPVNLGFLDFSTAERRAAACAEEVRLNRRLSPDIYLGVVQIVERDGNYFVGGSGRLGGTGGGAPDRRGLGNHAAKASWGSPILKVEPVVQMRRLPEAGMLPNLLAAGAVDARLVRRIARRVAAFHARAATGPGVDEYGSLTTVRANWEENFTQMVPFIDRVLPAALNHTIRAYVERFLSEQAGLFERRVQEGRIREGHGDLHAASICVVDGRPRFFDCLEFNPRFRCADVAAEVAFLAMDLTHFGRADLAQAFVGAYIRASGDAELAQLLDFYACYRAYVRGKVRCLRLTEPGLTPAEEGRVRAEARAYFDLAWSYAGGLPRPMLLMTMGLPASGKSSLARALAGRLGFVQISSDVVRKQLAGLQPTERGDATVNEGLYAPAMTRRTYAALRRRAARWLRLGRSVVLDATYGRAVERARVRQLATRLGVPLTIFLCRTDEATIIARLAARNQNVSEISDARLEDWPALRAAFSEPNEMPDVVVVDSGASIEHAVEEALTALRDERRVLNL